ncbi:ergothioneine biosynthesis protein EgtB [Leeuwenhoekiella palythoae]|uniref:Ergothioneine biosynthesis protein EgtB n=1 Tax=Leeuwenhoekiella palythoae TaxID=573501 RepID=A0A1M5WU23_9FLAO|nr:ergothioneine biosynthesis protein EgtB [Leeuwenhoekiella palythoae]RXG31525.1 ergothioneine biosynthesis protein EgtB [Leeuwenhoekiella palythoae]SHH90940.1 ergothioneine biosynthesis protein EgtB [Leeuwenhoekiella palythoae]
MLTTTTTLLDFLLETRTHTETLCKPLEIEDYVVQPIVDVSPPKWHLGHTTWFFEDFILKKFKTDYKEFDPNFSFVFNSYYESMGARVVRTDRGNLSRPTVREVYDYRAYVTNQLQELLEQNTASDELQSLVEIGIHHEKQHQELLLTDIKYILGNNPLQPIYSESFSENPASNQSTTWIEIPEGIYEIGHNGEGFCYDNELGKHKVFLNDFKISNQLVSNKDYLEFIEDGGYDQVLLWHSEGWDWVKSLHTKAPQYWQQQDNLWFYYGLDGVQPLNLEAPATHISYYEAFAFAQWKTCRLPTEFEWEVAHQTLNWGARWEWTESAYLPYPNYQKAPGALGEYNGKFMVSQKVLRGGSIATSNKHTRPTYRNFFHPQLRWQFTGIRLAQ